MQNMQFAHRFLLRWQQSFGRYPWWAIPALCWTIMVVIVVVRVSIHPLKSTVYPTFAIAGQHFAHGESVYGHMDAIFRYTPIWAGLFSLGNDLPFLFPHLLWRLLNLVVLIWGAHRFQQYFLPQWNLLQRALWWTLMLPFCQGSFNNAQANLLLLGFLLAALTYFAQKRYWHSALCQAVAISMKVYPVALSLLLVLIEPVGLLVPLLVSVGILGLAPYALQSMNYINGEYRNWVYFCFGDLRVDKDISDSNRDVWMLIRLTALPIDYRVYQLLQASTALALAGWTWTHRSTLRSGIMSRTTLLMLFNFAIAWMLILGPASESSTYALVAPLAAYSAVILLTMQTTLLERLLILLSFTLMILAHLGSAFTYTSMLHSYGIHPIGAFLLAITVHLLLRSPDRQGLPSLSASR